GDAMRQHACLARTGASEDQQRAARVRDSGSLLVIQWIEDQIHASINCGGRSRVVLFALHMSQNSARQGRSQAQNDASSPVRSLLEKNTGADMSGQSVEKREGSWTRRRL